MQSKMHSVAKSHWAVLIFFILVFLTYLVTNLSRNNARGTIDNHLTDHISHVSMSIAFLKHGSLIFEQPANRIFPVTEQQEAQQLVSTLGWNRQELFSFRISDEREMVLPINWSYLTRPYPPGNYFYHLPEALLRFLNLSHPIQIAKWTIVKYGLAGLMAALVLAFVVLGPSQNSESGFRIFSAALVCLLGWHLIHLSFAGIYDPAAIALVCLSAYFLNQGQPIHACALYGFAVFLHFRSLWYIAIPLAACVSLARDGQFRQKIKDHRRLIAAGIVCCIWSLLSFIQLYPSLAQWPMNNTNHLQNIISGQIDYRPFISLIGLICLMVVCKENLLAFCAASALLFAVRTPQVMPWHGLFAIPLIALGTASGKPIALVLAVFFTLHFARMFFGYDFMFPGPFW